MTIRFGSGPGIRTLNLAVNRSLRPVQKWRPEFAEYRCLPRFIAGVAVRNAGDMGRRPGCQSEDGLESALSSPTDERHLRSHHGHELNIGIEREARHVQDCARYMLDVNSWLDLDIPVRLHD